MIQIDIIETLLKKFKQTGWKQNGGYAIRGNPRVLDRNGKKIAVVKPISIDISKGIQNEIDKFFRSLADIIVRNGIKDLFLPGGGTVPIPPFFIDECRRNGVNIHIVTRENIDDFDR